MSEIQDFSLPKREPIRFKIDDDVFEAVPSVGADVMRDVIGMTDAIKVTALDQATATPEQLGEAASTVKTHTARALQFLDTVLLPESAQRFGERMRSIENPITLEQAFQVWTWLIGQYGGRPTVPSSPSANGHGGTGTSSTAGASAAP